MIDQIVDLIIREALGRIKSKGDNLPSKVCEVNVEVMLKVIEIVDNHLSLERRENATRKNQKTDRNNPMGA